MVEELTSSILAALGMEPSQWVMTFSITSRSIWSKVLASNETLIPSFTRKLVGLWGLDMFACV